MKLSPLLNSVTTFSFKPCQRVSQFREVPRTTTTKEHVFSKVKKFALSTVHVILSEDKIREHENAKFTKTGASKQ